jgi:predicted type IV restriction endonuclease
MGTSAPKPVVELVELFDRNHKTFLSGNYKEEQLRTELLNPFFTALDWDMDNKQGLSEIREKILSEVTP